MDDNSPGSDFQAMRVVALARLLWLLPAANIRTRRPHSRMRTSDAIGESMRRMRLFEKIPLQQRLQTSRTIQ